MSSRDELMGTHEAGLDSDNESSDSRETLASHDIGDSDESESKGDLLEKSPAFSEKLRKRCVSMLLFSVSAIVYANQFVIQKLSQSDNAAGSYYNYSIASVLTSGYVLTILLSLLLAKATATSLEHSLDRREIIRWFPQTLLAFLDMVLKFMVLKYLGAPLASGLMQVKLLTDAVGTACLFKKPFSDIEIMAILILAISLFSYSWGAVHAGDPRDMAIGLSILFVEVVVGTVKKVAVEFKLKGLGSVGPRPFYVQQIQSSLIGLPLALCYFAGESWIKQTSPVAFFHDWNWMVVLLVVFQVLVSWLGRLLQKRYDTVVLKVTASAAIPIVFVETILLGKTPFGFEDRTMKWLKIISLIVSVANFAIASRTSKKMRKLKAL